MSSISCQFLWHHRPYRTQSTLYGTAAFSTRIFNVQKFESSVRPLHSLFTTVSAAKSVNSALLLPSRRFVIIEFVTLNISIDPRLRHPWASIHLVGWRSRKLSSWILHIWLHPVPIMCAIAIVILLTHADGGLRASALHGAVRSTHPPSYPMLRAHLTHHSNSYGPTLSKSQQSIQQRSEVHTKQPQRRFVSPTTTKPSILQCQILPKTL